MSAERRRSAETPVAASGAGGISLAVAAMAIVGSSVAVSGALTDHPLFLGQLWRYAGGAVVLWLLLLRTGTRGPRLTVAQFVRLLLLALIGLMGFNVCLVRGAEYADPSVVGVVVGVTPLALAVLAPLLEGRRPNPRVLLSAAVVVLGAALVQGFGQTTALGAFYAVGALAGEVVFSLLAASLLPLLGPLRLTTWVCTLVLPLLVATILLTGEKPRWPDGSETVALAWMTVPVTVVAFLTWYSALGRIGVERAAVFPGLIPVSALICTALLGTGQPSGVEVVGALVVAGGVVAGVRSSSRPARVEPPESYPPTATLA